MTRRKSVCVKWTLVLICVVCPFAYSRPQDSSQVDTTVSSVLTETTENTLRSTSQKTPEEPNPKPITAVVAPDSARDVKSKLPIRDSIKIVANQLLDKNESDNTLVADTRIPPKLKSQLSQKHKIKTRNEDGEATYNGHAGEAVPITLEEVDTENKIGDVISESSTSNDGISTWILVSNPTNASTASTEPTKTEEIQKKPKPPSNKNKTKRPQNNKTVPKRPTAGSINKSDMITSGSAINENVYNKMKDSGLSNAQKIKSASTQRTTTTTSTEVSIPKKENTKAQSTTKPKKKNKIKQKVSTTEAPEEDESALLPMEPKEQEIELEVSTPPTTTKKPKRNSSKSKNKTKKRKPSTPKPEIETEITENKTSKNKTKSAKPAKKPEQTGAITTQLYNYFSREVMPSVGVGVIGLASLVGIASYFLYPFSTPVRRTFEVDKKDDIYKYNAEEYANEGNGQAEEEMLGTVLAGMPSHAKQKLNPYAAQTPHVNRYSVKKDQDLRYRHGAVYDPTYSRYPQQKTGIAHAAVYAKPVNYNPQYETRHVYTTEGKYNFDKPQSYMPYAAVEPIYAAPQTSSGVSSYGNDNANSVVYGVKPTSDSDFKPVYPFNNQYIVETTSSPVTYAPTSMYLGSNNEEQEASMENSSQSNESDENKFVVGNVPKELVDSDTPAVVPEHGPRKLKKRSISSSLEEILRAEKENKDIFISNEIDDFYSVPVRNLAAASEPLPMNDVHKPKEVIPIYAVSMDPAENLHAESTTLKNEIIENISTLPLNNDREKTNTATETEMDVTTKAFKVYEVFSTGVDSSTKLKDATKYETTTQFRNIMTETTTDIKLDTTSTLPPSPSPIPDITSPKPTQPDVITYPPLNQSGGLFTFLKRLVDFKFRLGLSILQSTSESLNRYLRSMEDTMTKVAKASKT